MIHHLRGKLLRKQPTFAIVDCGGVGFGVHVTPKDVERMGNLGTEVALHIYTHITEGDARLYGFLDATDLEYFLLLFGVERVGPKTAMAVVSVMPRDVFFAAVSSKDGAAFLRVPGIGQKTAERILFELREKISSAGAGRPAALPVDFQAVDALLSLGFDRRSAEKAVAQARESGASSLESLVTASLRRLGSGGGSN